MEGYIQRDHLEYPGLTMFQMVERIARQYPNEPAYEFYGRKTSYASFIKRIERAARAFIAIGLKSGDTVTVCMPNLPQALDCFYALDRIGAVANMVHPLSARSEISFYLNVSKSKAILTLDMFYEKVADALKDVKQPVTVLTARIQDELNPILKAPYVIKKGKEYLRFPDRENSILWSALLKKGTDDVILPESVFDPTKTAVILYSGGTTGEPKGICLSDLNFNACAMQAREAIGEEFRTGLKMLSCMPCFHGFGLGINLHTVLIHGACCVLMPTFNNKSYASMIARKKPNFIAGVPTIFEALLHAPGLDKVDLGFLHGVFCGGDSLSPELKKKIDAFLKDHGASTQVREGYGLTECVTASCLTPRDTYREGSIGIPFPDTSYRIVRPGTDEDVPAGEEGEIILTGPTLMLGYLNDPDETAMTMKKCSDGRMWLYTGDIGRMDGDGYVYFVRRIKRLIITNGYNVYPGQIENMIDAFPDVSYSCVIGVKDPRRMQRVKAYVVLRNGVKGDEDCRRRLMEHLREHVASYALPREIEFRDELPKTLVGKVAYRVLEESENTGSSQDAPAATR